ncbi:hypothetical protein [Tropicimonas marinistellae]|uniref:hypothetical protein n=1 Tax=Tropicimonas marinistellae TaxID=1739787 RepID=UPI00082E8C28|nr:hypothetical protein [Tropicimonas marinistellae]
MLRSPKTAGRPSTSGDTRAQRGNLIAGLLFLGFSWTRGQVSTVEAVAPLARDHGGAAVPAPAPIPRSLRVFGPACL